MSFVKLLKQAGITKAELSRRFEMNPRTISAWGDDAPQYAILYLNLLIECNCYEFMHNNPGLVGDKVGNIRKR